MRSRSRPLDIGYDPRSRGVGWASVREGPLSNSSRYDAGMGAWWIASIVLVVLVVLVAPIRKWQERRLADPATAESMFFHTTVVAFTLTVVFIAVGVGHALWAPTMRQSIAGIILALCAPVSAVVAVGGVIAIREERARKRSEHNT